MRLPSSFPDHIGLLARYLTGALSADERGQVEKKLESDPDFRAEYERLRAIWIGVGETLRDSVVDVDVERAWQRLAAELEEIPIGDPAGAIASESKSPRTRAAVPPSTGRRRRWRSGRGLAVLCAVAMIVLTTSLLIPRLNRPGQGANVAVDEIVTEARQRLVVSLEDGSRVTLAPGSRLLVPRTFGVGPRELRLEGRGYFDVAPDPERPFLVQTDNAVTSVLGTEFDVRAYPGQAIEVVVRSGRVAVRPGSAPDEGARTLSRGERGVIHPAGHVEVETDVDVESVVAWIDATLTFQNASLSRVIPELEQWFDVSIELEEASLGQRRLTASFRDEPLDSVLTTLAVVVDARVERSGRQVLFSPLR